MTAAIATPRFTPPSSRPPTIPCSGINPDIASRTIPASPRRQRSRRNLQTSSEGIHRPAGRRTPKARCAKPSSPRHTAPSSPSPESLSVTSMEHRGPFPFLYSQSTHCPPRAQSRAQDVDVEVCLRGGVELGFVSLLTFVLSVVGGVHAALAVPSAASVLLPPLIIPAPAPLVPTLAAASPLLVGIGCDSKSPTSASTIVLARERAAESPKSPTLDESLLASAVSHLRIGTTLVPVHKTGDGVGEVEATREGIAGPILSKQHDVQPRGLFGLLPVGFSSSAQGHPGTSGGGQGQKGIGAEGGKAPPGSAEKTTLPTTANPPKAGLGGPHGILPALGLGMGVGLIGGHVTSVSETGQGSVVPTLATTTNGENERPAGTGTLGDVAPSQTVVPSAVPGSVGTDVDSSDSQSCTGDEDGSQRVDPVSGTTVGSASGGPSELGQWKAMGIAVISITLLGTVMLLVIFFDKWWGFVCDVLGIKKRTGKALHEQGEEEDDRWEGQKVWVGQAV